MSDPLQITAMFFKYDNSRINTNNTITFKSQKLYVQKAFSAFLRLLTSRAIHFPC